VGVIRVHYTITHTTKYAYTSPVSVCQNIVALTPRDDYRVNCMTHRIRIRPNPINVHRRTDFFGNQLTIFSIDENHEELTISAVSRVKVESPDLSTHGASEDWQSVRNQLATCQDPNWLLTSNYLYDSPRITRSKEYADYARKSFPPGASLFEAALKLNGCIYREFKFDASATETHTPTHQVFVMRKGVCQDFAHVMIGCLRSLGIPARYVSGYLRTIPPPGKQRLIGADQSHAWVAVYCGQQQGWIEMDPTNNTVCSTDHIPIAWGRDYTDVVPVRGAYLGGGESSLSVSVDVIPVES
jgi:transglutaminase-like putative cysteine protease